MKYVTFILFFALLSFSTVYIYNAFTLREKGKENFKISCLCLILSIPIGAAIAIVIFLALKLLNWILPVDISNYKIFIMSFASIFIIFVGESIIKIILSSLVGNYLEKKYKDENLSENEMLNIINKKSLTIEILKMCSMFFISFIIYVAILNSLNIEDIILISTTTSIVNSILYSFMFKSKRKYMDIKKI